MPSLDILKLKITSAVSYRVTWEAWTHPCIFVSCTVVFFSLDIFDMIVPVPLSSV